MTYNRRRFIKYSAYSSAALLTTFCQVPKATTNTDKTKKLGVALVGLGGYSNGQLAPALQLTEHCYLAGIVTGSPEKIPVWQEKYGIKDSNVYNYDNMHQIANNDEIDILYIVVPPSLHAKYSIIAANTGKHVWCEKPMAMSVEECQNIMDACNKNKVSLAIGYRMQHEPNTKTLIEYAKTQPYGAITSINAMACYNGGGGTSWRHQKAMGGGALYDMGVYAINGIRYAAGKEPIAVRNAKQFTKRPELFREVDETTEFELVFKNGLIGYGKTSVGDNGNQLKVNCEKGWYQLSPMQGYNGVKGDTSDGKLLNIFIQNQQARQMDDDALAILNKTKLIAPGEEGQRDIRIVQAIIAAAQSGKEVTL